MNIAWFVHAPMPNEGGFGLFFMLAEKLAQSGNRGTLYHISNYDDLQFSEFMQTYYPFVKNVEYVKYTGSLEFHDICVCHSTTTIYELQKQLGKIKYPFYFVTDYEPSFYPVCSTQMLTKNVFNLGLNIIVLTLWLKRVLKDEYDLEVPYLPIPINKQIYNTSIVRTKPNLNIVFFFKLSASRRCCELGIEALRIVKSKRPSIEIILFGTDKIETSIPFKYTNVGSITNPLKLAELYRNADLGMVFSATNPSKMPYEMMSCGLATADLKLRYSMETYENEKNVFLFNIEPAKMAQDIIEVLDDDEERKFRAQKGCEFVQKFKDEEQMAKDFEKLLLDKVNVL